MLDRRTALFVRHMRSHVEAMVWIPNRGAALHPAAAMAVNLAIG